MSKKIIFFITFILLGLVILALYQKLTLDDGKLHLVFCNVGQGDAILIRMPKGEDILVDGGPDERVLDCLGKHLPFWDRTLEMIVLTHPQADHLTGLISVMKSYSAMLFVSPAPSGAGLEENEGFKQLKSEIAKKGVKTMQIKAGDKFKVRDGVVLQIFWPKAGFASDEVNDSSLVSLVSYGDFETLLTGDASFELLNTITSNQWSSIEVLKVPHHGSRTGLNGEFLDRARPRLAVVSVGKNNQYGHPHQEVIKELKDKDIKILRTDLDGEVEVTSDRRRWWVEIKR